MRKRMTDREASYDIIHRQAYIDTDTYPCPTESERWGACNGFAEIVMNAGSGRYMRLL